MPPACGPTLPCLGGGSDPASPSTRGLTLPLGSGSCLVSSSVPWDEFVPGLWEYVQPESEEEEVSEVIEKVPQNLEVKVPEGPVTNLAMLARLHGLEESNLMYWIFEFGEEEGLMRAIDEMLDRLNFETESVASEVPWKGDVLQVHPQVSRQPTEKEEPSGLGIQKVRGGSSLAEWYLGLQEQGLGEGVVDGYFTTLGGRILNPEREVSGLSGGAVRGVGKVVEVPNIGEWQCTFCGAAHCWNTRLSCCRCGTLRNWQSGGAGHGGLVGGQGRGNGVQAGVVGQRPGAGSGFFRAGRGGVCYERGALVRPNWS